MPAVRRRSISSRPKSSGLGPVAGFVRPSVLFLSRLPRCIARVAFGLLACLQGFFTRCVLCLGLLAGFLLGFQRGRACSLLGFPGLCLACGSLLLLDLALRRACFASFAGSASC